MMKTITETVIETKSGDRYSIEEDEGIFYAIPISINNFRFPLIKAKSKEELIDKIKNQ